MSEISIKAVLLALLVAAIFSFVGLQVLSDGESTYGLSPSDNRTTYYQDVIDESDNISSDMNQTTVWLKQLTSGDLVGFVFSMPTNVAKILGLFVEIPSMMFAVFSSTLAIFGIPPFITGIISVMGIVLIALLIIGIWAQGRL